MLAVKVVITKVSKSTIHLYLKSTESLIVRLKVLSAIIIN